MKSDGVKKREFSGELILYVSGNIKRSFLLAFLFMIFFEIDTKSLELKPGRVLQIFLVLGAWILCAIAIVFMIRLFGQFISAIFSTLFGFGWHEGRLTDRQLKHSIRSVGLQEKMYSGCTFVYWKGLFMKRFLEDVK